MKVVNSPVEANGKKKALLEDAPSSNVYSQLQKLTAQNPVCEYFSSSQKVDFRVLPVGGELPTVQNMHSSLPAIGKNLLLAFCVKPNLLPAKPRCRRIEALLRWN